MFDPHTLDQQCESIEDAPHVGAMVARLDQLGVGELADRPLTTEGGVSWLLRPILADHGLVLDDDAGLRGLAAYPLDDAVLARLRSWMGAQARRALLARAIPHTVEGIRSALGDRADAVLSLPAMHLVMTQAASVAEQHADGLYAHTLGSILQAPVGPCERMRSREDPVPTEVAAVIERCLPTFLYRPADAAVLHHGLTHSSPAHPDGAWLWEPLIDQWSQLVTAHGPGGVDGRSAWHVDVSLEGPSLQFVEGDHELARIELNHAPADKPVRLRPERGRRKTDPHAPRSLVSKHHGELTRDLCAHALDLLRRTHGPSRLLRRAMGERPGQARVLDLLDVHLQRDDLSTAWLGWRVTIDEHQRVDVHEVECLPDPEGDGWRVRRFPSLEAMNDAALTDADDRVREARHALVNARLGVHRGKMAVAMIRALRGHPRVFVGERGNRPLRIRGSEAVLDLHSRRRGLMSRWEITDGHTISSADALRLIRDAGDGRYGLHWADDDELVVVDFRHAEGVLLALDHAGDWIPPGAIDGFLERLPAVATRSKVRLDARLEGEARAPDCEPIVRLSARPAGRLAVEIRVAPGGHDLGLYPPGEGPSSLYGADDGQRFVVHRDPHEEERLGVALARDIRLAHLQPEAPWRWPDVHLADAVEVMKALADRPGLTVEWLTAKRTVHQLGDLASFRLSLMERGSWWEVGGEVEIPGGPPLPLDELLRQLRGGQVAVAMSHEHVLAFTEELRQELTDLATLTETVGKSQRLSIWSAPALADLVDRMGGEPPPSWGSRLAALRGEVPEAPLPELQATLRPYQVDGIRWLQQLSEWAPGGCLADDMGLGKTLQALGLLVHRMGEGPALVVVPNSVLRNWAREAERFAPQLTFKTSHGPGRHELRRGLGPGDVLLTTWGTMLRDVRELSRIPFHTIVLDEAQAIKNSDTVRARAVRDLDGGFLLALSGTPIENALEELWSLFDVLAPGLLGSETAFHRRFVIPYLSGYTRQTTELLSRLIQPFLLRRTKSQVASDLPPRDEIVVDVTLSPHERAEYERVRRSILASIDRRSRTSGKKVLAAITRLRQLACHPRLVDPAGPASSSKLAAVRRSLLELTEAGHQVLVFSQWVTLLDLLDHLIAHDGLKIARLDGGMSLDARQEQVDRFQEGRAEVFLVSLHAGGTGLNLTAATYVIHLDAWWNPASHDQATDRAHRIGQDQPVTVLHFVSEHTVEDAIVTLQEKKRVLVEGVLSGTDQATRLTADEMVALIEDGGVSEVGLGHGAEGEPPPSQWPQPEAVPAQPDDLVALLGPTLPWPLPGLPDALAHRFVAWGSALRAQRSGYARNQAKALYRLMRWAVSEGRAPEHVDELEELAVAYRRALDLGLVEDPRRGDRSTAPTAVRKWLASRG